jgi:hypothetical protein
MATRGARDKVLAVALAAVCVAFPLRMLQLRRFQGHMQRAKYLPVLAWPWAY